MRGYNIIGDKFCCGLFLEINMAIDFLLHDYEGEDEMFILVLK